MKRAIRVHHSRHVGSRSRSIDQDEGCTCSWRTRVGPRSSLHQHHTHSSDIERDGKRDTHSQRPTIILNNNLHAPLRSSRHLTRRILVIEIGNSSLYRDTLRSRDKTGDLKFLIVLSWNPRFVDDGMQDSFDFCFCEAISWLLWLRLTGCDGLCMSE